MDKTLRRLPPPIVVSTDLSSRLLEIDSLLLTVCNKHKELHNRVVALVSTVTDLRKTALEVKERILQNKGFEDAHPSEYLWRLLLLDPIPNVVYKGEQGTLGLSLQATGEAQISPNEDIYFVTQVMNSTQSRVIESSVTGESILRGGIRKASYNTEKNRFSAVVSFQIDEVSSHFEEGCLTLVVQVKCPRNMELQPLIQPYVIEGLVVKSKSVSSRKSRSMQKR